MSQTERHVDDGKRVCGHCGEEGEKVRVWESIEDYEDNVPPDYVGCYACGTFLRISPPDEDR